MTEASLLRQTSYVNGRWIQADTTKRVVVNNPANGEKLADIPDAADSTPSAIEAAHHAGDGWRRTPAVSRADLLQRFYSLMLQHTDDLAHLLTSEQGKPLREARAEVLYAASFVRWFAEEARRVYGETIPADTEDTRILVLREPVGVCAAITPWNFPLAMVTRKVAPALAAGCTMVLKPASETPLSALALALLAERAGIPAGVLNVVVGDAAQFSEQVLHSPKVRKISFTGSTEVGKLLMRGAADTMKRLTLELGGDAPFLVFEDADLELAIEGAMFAKYRNAGQTCICINRFFVHESLVEKFSQMLASRSAALKVGAGLDPEVEVGPLISSRAYEKVQGLLDDAKQHGAVVLTKPDRPPLQAPWIAPTVIKGVTDNMRVTREEIFGPICAVRSFRHEQEVLELANRSEYGLAAYVYTRDLARGLRVAEQLEVGIVGLNNTKVSCAQAPFGGVKQSGFGREGSRHGIDEYLNLKYLSLTLPTH